ncbi:alpha/beta fold hydrolase [Ningiella sp. W23]|uniref:alpha/beta fold hydrolase n=1 Tax=Ningiella sp. W23 TaxID=3023715 RepID=UPI003757CDAE
MNQTNFQISKEPILMHFAHANSFPAGSYRAVFDEFRKLNSVSENKQNVQIFALDKFAHDSQFPINDNWHNPVDELIHHITKHVEKTSASKQKVIAIGHSFGAVISYIACCKRPELFAGLIMLDPPLITGFARFIFRFAKGNRLIDKITPAKQTQMRKRKWHKHDDLVAYFSERTLFKNMEKRCIEDYISSVTEHRGEHRLLSFDPDIEASIFRTIPHNLPDYYGKLECPAKIITGGFTDVCIPRLRNPFLKANPEVEHQALHTGGHMFPLEHPKQTAHAIHQTLVSWAR